MAIKRVDVEEQEEEVVGWSWKDINNGVETLTVSGPYIVLNVSSEDAPVHYIFKTEIKHWIKALKEAEKYFEGEGN